MPHGRAASRAGDRLGRPPHRPHADRRRGRRVLLDARPTPRRPPWPCTAPRPARRCSAPRRRLDVCGAPGLVERGRRLRQLTRAPAEQLARQRGRLHQKTRELRAAGRRGQRARGAELTATHLRVLARKAGAAARPATPSAAARDLAQLSLALAAHDPERTLARGYALVEDDDGGLVTSRGRGTRRRPALGALPRRPRRARGWTRNDTSAPTSPPPSGSSRSSSAWTRARRAARDAGPRKEGRELVDYCAGPSSRPWARAWRSCASTSWWRAWRRAGRPAERRGCARRRAWRAAPVPPFAPVSAPASPRPLVRDPHPALENRDRLVRPSGQAQRAPEVVERVGVGEVAGLARRPRPAGAPGSPRRSGPGSSAGSPPR